MSDQGQDAIRDRIRAVVAERNARHARWDAGEYPQAAYEAVKALEAEPIDRKGWDDETWTNSIESFVRELVDEDASLDAAAIADRVRPELEKSPEPGAFLKHIEEVAGGALKHMQDATGGAFLKHMQRATGGEFARLQRIGKAAVDNLDLDIPVSALEPREPVRIRPHMPLAVAPSPRADTVESPFPGLLAKTEERHEREIEALRGILAHMEAQSETATRTLALAEAQAETATRTLALAEAQAETGAKTYNWTRVAGVAAVLAMIAAVFFGG